MNADAAAWLEEQFDAEATESRRLGDRPPPYVKAAHRLPKRPKPR